VSAAVISRLAVLAGPHQLGFETSVLEPSRLEPSQFLAQTLVSVISPGTELAAYTGQPPLRPGTGYPRVQGYCNVARVQAVGTAVQDLSPGDRVLSFKPHCSHFIGTAQDVLLKLPDAVESQAAACTYLYHLGYNAVLRADVRAGSRVIVMGLGVLGLCSVAMAALAGAEVYAISEHVAARRLALDLGAHDAKARANAVQPGFSGGPDQYDVVIHTTNSWADWALSLALAAQRATIAVLGFPGRTGAPGDFNPLDSRHFYAKQLRIEAVGHSPEHPDARGFARFNERANLKYLLDLVVRGRLKPQVLLSGRYPGERLDEAYQDLLARRNAPITYALQWTPE
jgi:threonine dehydrogenase-like Zn-dependent dehydrogenase